MDLEVLKQSLTPFRSDIIQPMSERGRIARSATLISIATFISRILGFVRDMVIAGYLGATGLSDTFFVAFRIPNLLRELFAEGSMSSAFIPVLTEVGTKGGEEEARRLSRVTFTFIITVVGAICVLGIIFAPSIVKLIAPGFTDKDKLSVTVLLTRIMFPFLLFVSLAAFTMGALNVKRVFFVPALASAWFNITIIITIVLLTVLFKRPVMVVAIGVTLGGMMQFISQAPSYLRKGYSFGLDWHFRHEALRKMGRLLLPTILGLAVAQVNIFVSTILASYLREGSITYLYYSMRLIQFPVGMFGVAMGMAVLPALSEHASRGKLDALREDFSFALRLLFFITVPAMAGLIALKVPIVNILFQRGEFDYRATEGTAFALMFYALGIWSMVGVRVVVSAFYSLQDTKTPVKVAVISMLTNIVLSIILMGPLKHGGLALSNSLASWLNFSLLFFFLRKRLGGVEGRRITVTFLKVLMASVLMGIFGYALLHGKPWEEGGRQIMKGLYLGGTILACIVLYFGISLVTKTEEAKVITGILRKKFSSK